MSSQMVGTNVRLVSLTIQFSDFYGVTATVFFLIFESSGVSVFSCKDRRFFNLDKPGSDF